MAKIKTSELEEIIKSKMKEAGLSEAELDSKAIDSIKNKIKEVANKNKETEVQKPAEEEDVVVDISSETPTDTPGVVPSPITTSQEVDEETEELYKKEGELDAKEEMIKNAEDQLIQKSEDLKNKEEELESKEEELKYKPIIPKVLEGIGAEKFFVFSENEISVGGEALSNTEFRTVINPDEKITIHELWGEKGVKKAEVYIAKFEKIGDITFDPFEGTSKFEEKRDLENKKDENSYKEIEEMPEPMEDAIEPIKDVTLEPSNDMGLSAIDAEAALKNKIDDILKDYLQKKSAE